MKFSRPGVFCYNENMGAKKIKKGKFIVLDGTDGSGKKTQTKILYERLRKEKIKAFLMDFPRYGQKSAGPLEDYLAGVYGNPDEVGPYRASIFYAVDRYAAGFELREHLAAGCVGVSDRYVAANMGHQGGKIKGKKEREKFYEWLYDLEYNIFGIPKPDLNIILWVPTEITRQLINKRGLKNKAAAGRDEHEKDLCHLKNAERTYLEIAEKFPDFTLVKCAKNGKLLPREEIHELVWGKAKKVLGIKN